MKYRLTPSMGEKEYALIAEFIRVGLSVHAARVLVCLISSGRAMTSKDIEVMAGMSQPQVHNGLKMLNNVFGWLNSVELNPDTGEKRGRRAKAYYLKLPPKVVVEKIFEDIQSRKEKMQELVKAVSKVCVEGGKN
jgi:predicted transcriptional regulator